MQNLELELTDLGLSLSVRSFTVTEAAHEPWHVSLLVRSDEPLAFEEVIGSAATFVLRYAARDSIVPVAPATFAGLVANVEDAGGDEAGHFLYRVEVVARLWALSQNRTYRIFQQTDEVTVVAQILDEWNIPYSLEVDPSQYKKRKYIVQYAESDLAFITRLLEAIGVTFLVLVVADDETVVLREAPHLAEPRDPIAFSDQAPLNGTSEWVTDVRIERRVRPGRYLLQDLDYRRPSALPLRVGAQIADGSPLERSLERFVYAPGVSLVEATPTDATPVADDKGPTRTDERFAQVVAQMRLEAKQIDRLQIGFTTNAFDLHPGAVFAIEEHVRPELDAPVLVVGTVLSGNDTGEWSLTCDARSTCLAYRPALRTPRPHVQGVESATVVGPPGSEIHTDEFGRVRVQFHWDRVGDRDDDSSCWLPVSQPWAGTGYGSIFLPRVGQEVFVEFLGGDPDRPVVSGRVYTNLQRVPYKLPDQASVTVLAKTNSLGGSGGYNEIKADDKGGAELLSFRAQRDLEGLVLREERRTIGVDRITRVGNDDRLIIAGVETREFTSNEPNAPRTVQTFTNALNKLEVGPSSVVCTPQSVVVTAPKIKLTTGEGGAEITLEGNKITITATEIVGTTSGAIDLKGEPIRLNCR